MTERTTLQTAVHLNKPAKDAADFLKTNLSMTFSAIVRQLLIEAQERVKRTMKREKTDE